MAAIFVTERTVFPLKRNVYLMYAMALLHGMVFYAPIATLYRQAVGISVFQITLIESISVALMILLEIPWGRVADRIGYRRTMIVCCLLYVVSKVIFWKADGFGWFLAERVLLSVVCAGLSGVDVSILYLSCDGEQAQKVFGIYNNLGQVGLLLAAGVHGLWMGENYRLAALATVFSYGAAAVLIFGLKEVKALSPHTKKPKLGSVVRQLLDNKKLLFLVLSVALFNETHQTITVFLNQLKYVEVGMSPSAISVAFLVMTVIGLGGGWSARLTKRLGEKRFGSLLFLAVCASCVLLAWTKLPLLAVLGIALLRLCFYLFQPLQSTLQNRMVTTEDRATALSVNAMVLDVAAIFTNLLFGKIADQNLTIALLFGAGLALVGFFLYQNS